MVAFVISFWLFVCSLSFVNFILFIIGAWEVMQMPQRMLCGDLKDTSVQPVLALHLCTGTRHETRAHQVCR